VKFVCAPDSFKGSIDAVAAAQAMAEGIRSVLPDAAIDCCPIGDGGEGTLASLLSALDGEAIEVRVRGMFGDYRNATFGRFENGRFAYVESAGAIGLETVRAERRNVLAATSFGVGELLVAAAAQAPARIIVGVGGSATNDGGCGMAQALGVRFLDAGGKLIRPPLSGGALRQIASIDPSRGHRFDCPLDVACDVRNPLTGPSGAAAVYAPQKGATTAEVALLDEGLMHLAELIRRDLGLDVDKVPGAGAAGGLGAGLLAFAGARLESGIDIVLRLVRFDARIRSADLCLTGEGRLDEQSLSGKACLGVARAAARARVPVVALVGAVGPGVDACLRDGLDNYVVIGQGMTVETSMHSAGPLLTGAAARLAAQYARGDANIGGRNEGIDQ